MTALTPEQLAAIAFLAGVLSAVLLCWLFFRQRQRAILAVKDGEIALERDRARHVPELEARVRELAATETALRERLSAVEAQQGEERKHSAEKLLLVEQAQAKLTQAFEALSSDALRRNNQSFLELAKETLGAFQSGAKEDLSKRQIAIDQLVRPVHESLEKVDARIRELEKARVGAYESITAQLRMMADAQSQLRGETTNLVKALRSPVARGRWGEIQLRRVVEMAGMLEHCDFYEQETASTETGRVRPDLLVRLPGDKYVVVDAKAPLEAYLEALEAGDDDVRRERLKAHASQIRAHIDSLTRKAYWEQFQPAPEFVVLFLPGETFFSAALEQDPDLIEFGADRRVILATPTTLIALLRAVFYGWRQQKLAQNAREISELGQELFKRLSDMGGHMDRLGRSLNSAVDGYNRAVGSLESRVLVTARKFQDLEAAPTGAELPELTPIDHVTRQVQAPELFPPEALETGEEFPRKEAHG